MDLLDGLIPPEAELIAVHYERLFIFALMWSFGALLELEDRSQMEMFLKKHKPKLDLPKVHPAQNENIFEFLVDAEGMVLYIICNFCLVACISEKQSVCLIPSPPASPA